MKQLTLILLTWMPLLAMAQPADSLLMRGDSCMQQHDTYEALLLYQRAYEENPTTETAMRLANCHYQRQSYQQCVALLNPLDEKLLSHEALRQLFFCYKFLAKPWTQIYWGEQLLKRFPYDGEVVAKLALAYCNADQWQNGIRHTQAYCQRDSTNIEVCRALADCLFIDQQFPAAERVYQRLLQLGDSTYNVLYSLGMCYNRMDSLPLARTYLLAAAQLNEFKNAGCLYRLGIVCNELNLPDEAVKYLQMAETALQPDPVVMKIITRSLGEAYYKQDHLLLAISAWKRSISYDETTLATYFNVATAYGRLQDFDNMRRYYALFLEQARQHEPNEQLQQMILQAENYVRTNAQ